ncbi:LOW QUALITY PROTEIN: ornithine decarboxylase 2-like [Plutella xylostella]|uniref:LOW QUALITY PROTEIN: ornithine decarboxylase 2-like n=1 Tax=Plutella xylostella TaxID=51655 RepID=UPI0020327638|nr:LOW QUALITY PROTEIN: ornithine decarboxylase 2-like [Plutella xylostella]
MIRGCDTITRTPVHRDPKSVIKEIVASGCQEDPFYVVDLGEVVRRWQKWNLLMPRIKPYYAVKCNNDMMLLKTLAALGAGFDCASQQEIKMVRSLGVSSDRIIFAQPVKMVSHISYASAVNVERMTFDSEMELKKIKQHMPHAKLVIRIRSDALKADHPLGIKFGCDPITEAPKLLEIAAQMDLQVIGVSFHVGSGVQEFESYGRAMRRAAEVFHKADSLGHCCTLLDIGGGFPGTRDNSIEKIAYVVNKELEMSFPDDVEVISEPGQYFAAAPFTLAVMVYSIKQVSCEYEHEDAKTSTMYFINDGVYGSFGDRIYDSKQYFPELLQPRPSTPEPCSIWGPTADALDLVVPAADLPRLRVGDWLLFRDMGAYSMVLARTFNGCPVPAVKMYYVEEELWCSDRNLMMMNSSAAAPILLEPNDKLMLIEGVNE